MLATLEKWQAAIRKSTVMKLALKHPMKLIWDTICFSTQLRSSLGSWPASFLTTGVLEFRMNAKTVRESLRESLQGILHQISGKKSHFILPLLAAKAPDLVGRCHPQSFSINSTSKIMEKEPLSTDI